MKKIGIFAAAFVLAAILAVSASAQTRPGTTTAARPAPATASGPVPDTKIAFIDTSAFDDEKEGIVRYVNEGFDGPKDVERFHSQLDELTR